MSRLAFAVLAAALALSACDRDAGSPAEPAPDDLPSDGSSTPPAPTMVDFPHGDPGSLVDGSGSGATDPTLWAPDMRFPMEKPTAYANSQVYGVGGMSGPAGGQCDSRNYSYPWRDNFCETRGYTNGFCPSGKGHQGQDIRPATCEKKVHWIVAPEAGEITEFGTYTVYLKADSGRIYRLLHMDMAEARSLHAVGARVAKGERLGRASNDFGSTSTTIHLHFEIKAPVTVDGVTTVMFVPPYSSLVDAYERLLAEQPAE